MIRSRNIPPLLSRITGDGINTALLVTADGELLGSSSDASPQQQPPPVDNPSTAVTGATSSSSLPENPTAGSNPNAPSDHLDFGSIGALVAEVAADYRRLGTELQNLDPRATASPSSGAASSAQGTQAASPTSAVGAAPGAAAAASSKGGGKNASASTNSFRCMIVELERGTVGVSAAGSVCYVVALADTAVEHGMLRARLIALADLVAESFSQL